MKREPKGQLCKNNTAIWAMQFIGEDVPSFYRLGYHIRGFGVIKVCDECRVKEKEKYQQEPA